MKVLTTFGKHPKTLSVVRSVGSSGREVIVTDDTAFSMSSYSKYCARSIRTHSPLKSPSLFMRDLQQASRGNEVDLVIPMDDAECDLLIDPSNSSSVGCRIALPSLDQYRIARSKYETCRLANSLRLRTPGTIRISRTEDISRIPDLVGLPAIVKPEFGSGSRGLLMISSEESLDKLPDLLCRHGNLVAQEYIPHRDAFGVSFLFNKGRVRATFAHRRLKEFPPSGGPSIVRESIRHQQAESMGRRILESLQWHGVAMVEFLTDDRTGDPVLIEVNPRFWGSLPLAVASGVDFPRLLCDVYEHGDCIEVTSYRLGVKCVNLLPFGIASVFAGGFASKSISLLRHSLRARCFDVESFQDPIPTLGAVLSIAYSLTDSDMVTALFDRKG